MPERYDLEVSNSPFENIWGAGSNLSKYPGDPFGPRFRRSKPSADWSNCRVAFVACEDLSALSDEVIGCSCSESLYG